jgi:hypothetical protein
MLGIQRQRRSGALCPVSCRCGENEPCCTLPLTLSIKFKGCLVLRSLTDTVRSLQEKLWTEWFMRKSWLPAFCSTSGAFSPSLLEELELHAMILLERGGIDSGRNYRNSEQMFVLERKRALQASMSTHLTRIRVESKETLKSEPCTSSQGPGEVHFICRVTGTRHPFLLEREIKFINGDRDWTE